MLRVGDGERLEQYEIDDGENRGGRADAERQRTNSGQREAGTAQQIARAVAYVLEQLLDPKEGAGLAMQLLGLFDAAVRAAGGTLSLIRRHPVTLEVFLEQGEVRVDLAGKLAL